MKPSPAHPSSIPLWAHLLDVRPHRLPSRHGCLFDVSWQGHRLTVNGELDLSCRATLAEAARDQLRELTDSRSDARPDIVVDLAKVRFIDAAGLGALIEMRNEFAAAGFGFSIINSSRLLRRLCDICEVSAILGISDRDLIERAGQP